jgi:hypothetical protein
VDPLPFITTIVITGGWLYALDGGQTVNQFLPLGGATAILAYVVGVLVQERRRWTRDRAEMQTRHDAELNHMRAIHRAQLIDRDSDALKTIEFLRGEVRDLRDEIRGLKGP